MVFYGKTDVGMRRAVNQDNFIIRAYSPAVLTAIVCDGMGGANGGSVASALAARAFMDVLDDRQNAFPLFRDMSEEEICDMLVEASIEANRAVYKKGSADQSLSGMGTTLVGCLVLPETIYTVNVGDSRMYLTGDGTIRQVTHDHSYVQYLVDIGKLTPAEARNSRNRNIITRAVGTERTVNADIFTTPHEDFRGEYIVLCSDGLTNHVEPEEIGAILTQCSHDDGDSLRLACEELVEKANERGGSDNITAVIASV
ncbi:MAG: Stp1/IreP family PP2C-type Ser/Thr phosphatase [Clostridia bacterium]|nr:Stp1/IreP family PP2C-type Ser/Thr phosphatase [Clostridia bacterium]